MMLFHHFTSWISITLLLSTCSRADEEHHKRIPSGFTGVRGKKSIPDEAYNAEDFDVNSNTVVQQVILLQQNQFGVKSLELYAATICGNADFTTWKLCD